MHVSQSGGHKPGPAVPFPAANLTTVLIKEVPASRLLLRICGNSRLLTEITGGCALRANRAWVRELMGSEYRPTPQ